MHELNTWYILKFVKRATLDNLVDYTTRRIGDSFFYYEYLCEFEAKKSERLERYSSVRDSWGTDLCKNPRKRASLPCPFNDTLATQKAGVLSVLAQLCFEEKNAVYPSFLVTIVSYTQITQLFTLYMPHTFFIKRRIFPPVVGGTILEHSPCSLYKKD